MMPMDVASGTELELILETAVSSETAKSEQAVRARVGKAVVVAGMTVIAEGAPVTGTVVAVERAGRVKGRASVALRFNQVVVANTPYDISTARIVREAEATKGEDAKKIGIGAGAGAVIGVIAGGEGRGDWVRRWRRSRYRSRARDSRGRSYHSRRRDASDDDSGNGEDQRADVVPGSGF